RAQGGAADAASDARAPDPDGAQAGARSQPQRDEDVGRQVDERESEAGHEERDLHREPGGEDVLEAERVVPLHLGGEPNDRAGEEEDEDRQAEQPGADPEAPGRARKPNLSGLERSAALERIKRPVPAGHLPPKLRRFPYERKPRRFLLIARSAAPTGLLTFPG